MKPKDKMPTRGKIVTAHNESPNAFWKYCHRYGTIIEDKSWEGIYGEHYRRLRYHIDGLEANVKMMNGEVIRYGYGLIEE